MEHVRNARAGFTFIRGVEHDRIIDEIDENAEADIADVADRFGCGGHPVDRHGGGCRVHVVWLADGCARDSESGDADKDRQGDVQRG